MNHGTTPRDEVCELSCLREKTLYPVAIPLLNAKVKSNGHIKSKMRRFSGIGHDRRHYFNQNIPRRFSQEYAKPKITYDVFVYDGCSIEILKNRSQEMYFTYDIKFENDRTKTW